MQRELVGYRRILNRAYDRYLSAERALDRAQASAAVWFPAPPARRGGGMIGDPGSAIRRLSDRRDRALARLVLARRALAEAEARTTRPRARRVLMIGFHARGAIRP